MTNCVSLLPETDRKRLALIEAQRRGLEISTPDGKSLPGAEVHWPVWLKRSFPLVCNQPLGARHIRLWEWFDALDVGKRILPRVEIWPRGGAKSTTTELGCVRACVKLSRRFVLYVSSTQDRADEHVANIGKFLEDCGVERAVNKYGSSKGWRRNQLRTSNGFQVAAYGLDVAARGVKLDQYRPDLIIFDDIDSQDDSERTTKKKIRAITTAIIPAGSSDCCYLFVQNLIHEEGIFAQLLDGRADFLHNREPAFMEPAVRGLKTEAVDRGDGLKRYRIIAGEPTWAGQDLATCEEQINEWGLGAFEKEAQHQVTNGTGYVFDVAQLQRVKPVDVPPLVSTCIAWDLAATEGDGDWTVGVLLGKAKNGTFYTLAVVRGQWASHRVNAAIKLTHQHYRKVYPQLKLHLPQDPAQAGKAQADQFRKAYPGAQVEPVTGSKAIRAAGLAEQVNLGNVYLVEQDLPEFLVKPSAETGNKSLCEAMGWDNWHRPFRECLRKFREDVSDQQDDDVDAAADAFNELVGGKSKKGYGW